MGHQELNRLRNEITKAKAYTRKERLRALEKIVQAEMELVLTRKAVVSSTFLFYCMALEEIEQFLKVFGHQNTNQNNFLHRKKSSRQHLSSLPLQSPSNRHLDERGSFTSKSQESAYKIRSNKMATTPINKTEEYIYDSIDGDNDSVSVGSVKSQTSLYSQKECVGGGISYMDSSVGNPISSSGNAVDTTSAPRILRVNTGVDEDLTDEGSVDDNSSIDSIGSMGSLTSLHDDGEHSVGSINSSGSRTSANMKISTTPSDSGTRSLKVAERLQAQAEKKKQREEMLKAYDVGRQQNEKKAKGRHNYHFKYQKPSSNLPPLPMLKNNYHKIDDTMPTAKHPQEGWIRFMHGSPQDYNCIKAAKDALTWYQNKFRGWLQREEDAWKSKHAAECISFLQRMDYLSGGSLSGGAGVTSDGAINDQSTFYTQYVKATTILDLQEILLSKFDVNFAVKSVNAVEEYNIGYALDLSNDDLEKSVGRHPASVAPRLLMMLGAFRRQDLVDAYLEFTKRTQKLGCVASTSSLEDVFEVSSRKEDKASMVKTKTSDKTPSQNKVECTEADKMVHQDDEMRKFVVANREHCRQASLHENLSPCYLKRYDKGFMELNAYMAHEIDICISTIQSRTSTLMLTSSPFITNMLFNLESINEAQEREMKELNDLTHSFLDQPAFGGVPLIYLLAPEKVIENKVPVKKWGALKSRMSTLGAFAGGNRGGAFIQGSEKPKSKLQIQREATMERLKKESEWKLVFHGHISSLTQEFITKRWIKVIYTLEEISIKCPSWMKPIYNFGDAPPPFSFNELIHLEAKKPQLSIPVDDERVEPKDQMTNIGEAIDQARGPKSKYTKMKEREVSVHECAKHLSGILKTRFYITRRQGELAVAEEAKLSAAISQFHMKLSELEKKIENASMFTSTKKFKQERDEILKILSKLDFKRKNLKPKLSTKDVDEIKARVENEISVYSAKTIICGWTTEIRVDGNDGSDNNHIENVLGEKFSKGTGSLLDNHEMWILGGIHSPIVITRRITQDHLTHLGSRRGSLYVIDGVTNCSSDYFEQNLAHVRSGFPSRTLCSQDHKSFATLTVKGRGFSIIGLRSLYCSGTKMIRDKEALIQKLIDTSNQNLPHSIEKQQDTLWDSIDACMEQQQQQHHVVNIDTEKLAQLGEGASKALLVDHNHSDLGDSSLSSKGKSGKKKKNKSKRAASKPLKYVQLIVTATL